MKPVTASIATIVVITLGTLTASAQSNVFPASGNVGIGTTSPGTSLEVIGDVTVHADAGGQAFRAVGRSSDNFAWAPLAFANDGTTYTGGMFYTPTSVALCAGGGLNQVMTWLPNGNVGVGNYTPAYTLDVSGTIRSNPSNGEGFAVINDTIGRDFFAGKATLGTVVGYANSAAMVQGTNSSLSANSNLALEPYGGSVGIGTASPGKNLEVRGEIASAQGGTGGAVDISPTVGGALIYTNAAYDSSNPTTGWSMTMAFVNGEVGIGTTNPTYPLTVNGTIRAKEVIVDTGWSDYVFEPGYRLMPLDQEEGYIRAHRHLPGMPSASEVSTGGVGVGDIQAKLLAKIEELTLRQIKQEKEIAALKRELQKFRTN